MTRTNVDDQTTHKTYTLAGLVFRSEGRFEFEGLLLRRRMLTKRDQPMHTMPVEVFKTNVNEQELAEQIVIALEALYPEHQINFDLDDCDRILRMEAEQNPEVDTVICLLQSFGIEASILPDCLSDGRPLTTAP